MYIEIVLPELDLLPIVSFGISAPKVWIARANNTHRKRKAQALLVCFATIVSLARSATARLAAFKSGLQKKNGKEALEVLIHSRYHLLFRTFPGVYWHLIVRGETRDPQGCTDHSRICGSCAKLTRFVGFMISIICVAAFANTRDTVQK